MWGHPVRIKHPNNNLKVEIHDYYTMMVDPPYMMRDKSGNRASQGLLNILQSMLSSISIMW